MSATPNSANLDLRKQAPGVNGNGTAHAGRTPADYAPGREALQALLAFSSLHEQIRRRKISQSRSGGTFTEVWAADDFVLDEVLRLVSERALAITGADGVALALREGDDIRCRASAGDLAPGPGVKLDPNSGFSGACYRSALIIRCDDTERDPRVDPEVCRRMDVRSMVAVPLRTEQGVIGLLEGFSRRAYGFNDSDVRSFSLLAELILAALRPQADSRVKRETLPDAFQTIQRIEAAGEKVPKQAERKEPKFPTDFPAGEPSIETLREVVAPVTEESSKIAEPAGNLPETPAPQYLFSQLGDQAQPAEPTTSKGGVLKALLVFFLVILALGAAGAAVWWWRAHRNPVLSPQQSEGQVSGTEPQTEPAPASPANTAPAEKDASQSQVTGIRHWSSEDSSTVAIDLQDQVQYEAHRLTDPERIYFDLHDTVVGAGVPPSIEVGDDLLVRIRVAQPAPGVTRVVMETKNSPNFSVSLEPNPYRLVVEIHSIAAKPKSASKIDLFAPMHRESAEQAASGRGGAVIAEKGKWLEPAAGDSVPSGRVPKFRLVLDAGHGGWDMGTVGRKGLLEKNLVLDIVARLGNLVSNRLGGEVIYTRHDDTYVSLESRTELANRSQADMFLSIHANYSDYPSARGVETYYTNTYSSVHAKQPGALQSTNVNWTDVDLRGKVQGSKHFAAEVQGQLYRALAAKDHALRNRGVREASYVVLTGTTMPAVLAEVSFVSSPTDEMSLQSAAYRQRIAEALYKGVAGYAAGFHRVKLASTVARVPGQ